MQFLVVMNTFERSVHRDEHAQRHDSKFLSTYLVPRRSRNSKLLHLNECVESVYIYTTNAFMTWQKVASKNKLTAPPPSQ